MLKTKIVQPANLTVQERNQMFQVLITYFDGQTRQDFERDLAEKNWVFILRDRSMGNIRGFSTLQLLQENIDRKPVYALFSGDTIVDKDFWGRHDLFRTWTLFALYLSQSKSPLYWFLISKGYRTYRLLPKFFFHFYPCYQRQTPPAAREILDRFASKKFPGAYDPKTGIIHFSYDKQRLKTGVGEITPDVLGDPHIAFFARANPRHMAGDELACLAQISIENLRLFHKIPGLRWLISLYGWWHFRHLV